MIDENKLLIPSHNRDDRNKRIQDMVCLAWNALGKKINLELLSAGLLMGKKVDDVEDPSIKYKNADAETLFNDQFKGEFFRIMDALNISYMILKEFNRVNVNNIQTYPTKIEQMKLLGPASYFGIHAHFNLEKMLEMLLKDPEKYFNNKYKYGDYTYN